MRILVVWNLLLQRGGARPEFLTAVMHPSLCPCLCWPDHGNCEDCRCNKTVHKPHAGIHAPARGSYHHAAVGGCARRPYPDAGRVVNPLFPRGSASSEVGLDALGPRRKKLVQVGWPWQGKVIGLLLRDCFGYLACPANKSPSEPPCEDWDLVYGGGASDGWNLDIPWLRNGHDFIGKMRAHQVFNPCMGMRATCKDIDTSRFIRNPHL